MFADFLQVFAIGILMFVSIFLLMRDMWVRKYNNINKTWRKTPVLLFLLTACIWYIAVLDKEVIANPNTTLVILLAIVSGYAAHFAHYPKPKQRYCWSSLETMQVDLKSDKTLGFVSIPAKEAFLKAWGWCQEQNTDRFAEISYYDFRTLLAEMPFGLFQVESKTYCLSYVESGSHVGSDGMLSSKGQISIKRLAL